jgi:hypothetical protein
MIGPTKEGRIKACTSLESPTVPEKTTAAVNPTKYPSPRWGVSVFDGVFDGVFGGIFDAVFDGIFDGVLTCGGLQSGLSSNPD